MDPLAQIRLGRTNLHVTRLGLGTSALGELFEPVSEDEAIATVKRALALGMNLFDTAPLYGHGKAEFRAGRGLAGTPRTKYVLATKVGRVLVPEDAGMVDSIWFVNLPPFRPVFDFSYDGAMRSFESSLKRLGVDRIDILHIHDPEEPGAFEQAMEGAYVALDLLRASGAISAISVGVGDANLLARFARAGDFDCFLLAGRYTLLNQTALDKLLPLCMERNIAIILGGPYNSGVLATGTNAGGRYDYQPADTQVLRRVACIESVCARYGVPLPAAALQFPLHHPAIASVIPGARSAHEVEQNLRMASWPIPSALWSDLKNEKLLPDSVFLPQ